MPSASQAHIPSKVNDVRLDANTVFYLLGSDWWPGCLFLIHKQQGGENAHIYFSEIFGKIECL